MQKTWVRSLIQEDPTCWGSPKPPCTTSEPMLSSPGITNTEPMCHDYWSLCTLGPKSTARESVKVLVAQSCPTVYDPVDCSLPGSSVHGILQARILEWGAIPFSKGSSWPMDQTWVSCTTGRFFTVWAPREPKKVKVLVAQSCRILCSPIDCSLPERLTIFQRVWSSRDTCDTDGPPSTQWELTSIFLHPHCPTLACATLSLICFTSQPLNWSCFL